MSNNKRIIPTDDKFIKDKKVCYLTYAKLQIESNWNQGEEHRYIYKNKINYSAWAKELRMAPKTLKNRIDYLKEVGLIVEKGWLYILVNNSKYRKLIPEYLLRILVNDSNTKNKYDMVFDRDTIKVYAYLGGWFISKKDKKNNYNFTKTSLLSDIGFKKSKSTLERINLILLHLNKLGLIKTEQRIITINGITTKKIELIDWKDTL